MSPLSPLLTFSEVKYILTLIAAKTTATTVCIAAYCTLTNRDFILNSSCLYEKYGISVETYS